MHAELRTTVLNGMFDNLLDFSIVIADVFFEGGFEKADGGQRHKIEIRSAYEAITPSLAAMLCCTTVSMVLLYGLYRPAMTLDVSSL
jgi:hypothetical protein